MFPHVLFAILVALPVASAGGWDDFSNNLATDLAPFLSLFGEQITKQYLSESVRPIDYFIFAMAPMGILTGVVSTIRVCGSPSLRAFIGRAQEGAGNAEAELCTSTSRDVCELYNSGGIARVFGRPKILEVVHDPSHKFSDKNDTTAGIYTFQEFIKRGKGMALWKKEESGKGMALWPWKARKKDTESAEPNTPFTTYAPNLSLNIGIYKQPKHVFFAIALDGLVLQVGVLVFASVATYYLKWGNNDNPPESYACPLVIIGTVLVCGGMFHCAFLIGESTKEEVWCRQEDSEDRSSMYWIQPGGQIIGDQTFDAFSHTDCDNKLKKYMTSRRNNGLQQPKLQVWVAVGITLSGFILQFTGLRGIHSAVSVAQLGVIMVMSVARAALRMKRLKSGDNCFAKFPDEILGHELDWLALRIGRGVIEEDMKGQPDSSSSVSLPSSTSLKGSPSPPSTNDQPRHFWRFCGAPDTNKMSLKHPSPNDNRNAAAIVFAYRTRLASLTDSSTPSTAPARNFKDEMVEVRSVSRQLGSLIEAAMKVIVSKAELKTEVKAAWESKTQQESIETSSMFWGINCTLGEMGNDTTKTHTIYLKLIQDREAPGSPWILQNKLELEGILGLWVWSLKSDLATEIEDSETGLLRSMALDVQPRRIVPTDKSIRTDLEMWLGDDMNTITDREYARDAKFADPGDASTIWKRAGHQDTATSSKSPSPSTTQLNQQNVRFFGRSATPRSQIQDSQISSFSSAAIQGSLVSACAQEVFASFFASILEIVDDIGTIDIQEAETFGVGNGLVAEIITLFTEMRLGPRQEALVCVIPSVIPHLKVPSASKALAAAKKIANQKRKEKEWERAESVLQWAWRICMNSQHSCTTATEPKDHELAKEATISLCELYRWALLNESTRSFGEKGLSSLENQKATNSVSACEATWEVIDCYVAIKNNVPQHEFTDADLLAAMEEGDLLTALVVLTHPPSKMESKTKGEALCMAASHGWTEVVLTLLELNGEADFKDKFRRTPLSYAAENGKFGVVKELLDWGVFPNSQDEQHITPLLYASEAGSDEIVALLLRDVRVFPDQRDKNQRTPLREAAARGYEAIVQRLLDTGNVDPTAKDRWGQTPLWYATAGGHEAIVKRLLDSGVDPDTKDSAGRTPLLCAVECGHEAIVKRLLDTGKVDPEAEDIDRKTPLSKATEKGNQSIVNLMQEVLKKKPSGFIHR
jgi:ankyrin repeat protein